MRRLVATLTCAATASIVAPALATPAHAQARAADPVAALKRQFVTGRGVSFIERTITTDAGKSTILIRRTGKFRFGRAGVAASDISSKFNLKAAEIELLPEQLRDVFRPEQTIRIGTTAYIKGGFFGGHLPADKTWLRYPGGPPAGLTSMFGQLISVTEPGTLKTLLSHASKRGAVYRGSTTPGELWRVSKWFRSLMLGQRPTGAKAKGRIDWRLYVNARGLITRLVSSYSGSAVGLSSAKLTTATAFTGWGGRVSIKAPAPDEVAERSELDLDSDEGFLAAS